MSRQPQIKLDVVCRGRFDHLHTNTVLVPGETPVANLWPAVVRALREQTQHDGSTIEKISLGKKT